MVQCTGPIHSSNDHAALNAKLTRDELAKVNAALEQLDATSSATLNALNKQAQALNGDPRATIEKRFQDLPHDTLLTLAIPTLKKSLIEHVDQRLPRFPRILNPPRGLRRLQKPAEPEPEPALTTGGLGQALRLSSNPAVSLPVESLAIFSGPHCRSLPPTGEHF